jgi:hypothetical protein
MTLDAGNLNDNHAQWQYPQLPPGYQPDDGYGLGITTSPVAPLAVTALLGAFPHGTATPTSRRP